MPFFKHVLENTTIVSDELIGYIAEIMDYFLDEAADYEAALIEKLTEDQKIIYFKNKTAGEKINHSYDVLLSFNYRPDPSEPMELSPVQYVRNLQKKIMLQARGFYYN